MSELLKLLPKTATGIAGLDDILRGGLPQGRPTLLCGAVGSGKTLLAMEFLVHGAANFNEPGIFMAFEETEDELLQNMASLGFDLPGLIADKKLFLDFVYVAPEGLQETGHYDLEGLFIRLGHAIDTMGAKRVVLDAVCTLFSGLSNLPVLHAELRRLFRWLKDKGITTIITNGQGAATLTYNGLEEYVSDCVILLDHHIGAQGSTRHLRVVKYRGSSHGTNEYPFLIDAQGVVVMPATSLSLHHPVSTARVSSGIACLDKMLGGRGFYRGTTLLVSGTAGSGKTSIAAHFAEAACRRDERVFYFSFEESPEQIVRNMRSIGIDLQPWLEKDLLFLVAARPAMCGLEEHLAAMYKNISRRQPSIVIVDPISVFLNLDNDFAVRSMLMRLAGYLKDRGATIMFTSLTAGDSSLEHTTHVIAPLIDTWLQLVDREPEHGDVRNRGLYILKSRGMAHSNRIREYFITSRGIELAGGNTMSTGSGIGPGFPENAAREQAAVAVYGHQPVGEHDEREPARRRQAQEEAAVYGYGHPLESEYDERKPALRQQTPEDQIYSLRASFEDKEAELLQLIALGKKREARLLQKLARKAKSRNPGEH